ncbi:MAG: LytTR family transcriptional regulator, partial [Acidobacteria bacterium]|nr:LytTR family transcriptional regulator [Acidobacteriota bacterium]
GQRSHLVRDTLARLGSQLDNSRFLRIHRSAIVNTSRIKELRPMPGGTYQVVMSGGNIVRSGRSYRENIALLLGNNHSPQKANASPQKC